MKRFGIYGAILASLIYLGLVVASIAGYFPDPQAAAAWNESQSVGSTVP